MKNIKIYKTADGSIGLYNTVLDEVYHSKFGAKTEAYEKFIEPALAFKNKEIEILDICYGIGYNTKCALENFKNISSIDCIEINKNLAKKSFEYEYNEKINNIIKSNIEKPDFINFYFEDVRCAIKKLNKKYDIIFHDGFAPHKQPELWSEELIYEISKSLKYDGLYCTYNHSKPVLNALKSANLFIGKTIKNDKIIGTVASFNKDLIKNPLDEFEMLSLNTKSAITYKDKDLCQTSYKILKLREEAIKNSNLMTLSSLKNNSKQ